MSGEIYYSDTREVLVDFTNSRDYSGLSNLYNNLKSDLNAAGISYRSNDTYYLLNMPGDVSITMALGLGLGLSRFFKSAVSNFQSLINQGELGMSDVCLFGSCQVSYPDHTYNSKIVTQVDNCYGYDKAHNNQFKQENPTAITVGYGNNKTETVHIGVGQQCLIDYSKFYNSSKCTGDICYLAPSYNARAKKSTYKFTLPRFCYGRVLYNIMAKPNGTWAIYFHQVRPRNIEIPTHPDRSGFHREEYNNFGVTSVMFYDASSEVSGWIMPQGPASPVKHVANNTDYNWSVLYSSTHLLTHPLIGIRRQPAVFNDTTTLPDIWTIKTINGSEIDPDIITRCCIDCRIPIPPGTGNHFKTKLYTMKSYHATTAECQSYIRRTKNDGTTWEWGGYDMIHRII